MTDDQVASILQEIRTRNEKRVSAMRCDVTGGDVPRLLGALDEVLKPHVPRTDRVLGSSCSTHRNARKSMTPVPGCEICLQDREREVCLECRDQFGDRVAFANCRARAAILGALTGMGQHSG